MRPSLRKGAYADLSSDAWQEIRVGMTNLDLTLSWGFVIRMERSRSTEAAQRTLPSQSPSSMEALPSPLSSRANPDGPYRLVATTGLHAIFFKENRTRCSDSKPRMGRPGKPRDLQCPGWLPKLRDLTHALLGADVWHRDFRTAYPWHHPR
jgi:hypothetical protein